MNKFLFALIILLSGCGQSIEKKPATVPDAGAGATSTIQYAKGFRIDYYDHYKVLTLINRSSNRVDSLLLLPQGASAPAGHAGMQVIHTPVKSLVVLSSAHVGLAEFAGIADRIIGLGSLKYISSPTVRQRIAAGAVKEVGLDNSINNELLVAMHPQAVLTTSNPEARDRNNTLASAGIPVVPVAEWLEGTPLGRAEWVKLLAALTDREEPVNKKFDSVAREYQRLAALGSGASPHPSVIIGLPYKGTWFTPAGESYMVRLLTDAGADYHWKDTRGTGSLTLNFETVAPVALTADYWINIGTANSKAEIANTDTRFTQFASFRTGALYNDTRRTNDIRSNDYWESGVANPQLVLADLIRILHSGLLPKDSLYYYKQLK